MAPTLGYASFDAKKFTEEMVAELQKQTIVLLRHLLLYTKRLKTESESFLLSLSGI